MQIATKPTSTAFTPELLMSAAVANIARRQGDDPRVNEPSSIRGGIEEFIRDYAPITLEETNQRSQMLKRVDNKYVLGRKQLGAFLSALKNEFAVLEIEGIREFRYSSCYFDDEFRSYYDHLMGRRLRFKVRTRHYIDSNQIYFEVKLKDKRGQTNKERIRCDIFMPERPGPECLSMLGAFYQRLYGKDFTFDIKPALVVDCVRCTLVSLTGGERMTIDYCLSFTSMDGTKIDIGNDFIIVETKSADGKGRADVQLKKAHIRQAKKLSKYCLGAILTGCVTRCNEFRINLKRVLPNVVNCSRENSDHTRISAGGNIG